jgi:hypothetical protein
VRELAGSVVPVALRFSTSRDFDGRYPGGTLRFSTSRDFDGR